ncbi:embryo-specific ATS3B-like [Olea europaea subsp. europaea]|uniref:Embryo-specific ATS3B-like n=1 Tax=Olea europaea subsp. europaea TaxID=158383 RepID=A0A8S0RNH6_OLEEU|nr:embryo-specific ATS3B-like [Olea europaea subsp. europaea]
MKMMRALFFTLLFTLIIIPFSQARSIFPRPQIRPSFKINTTENRRSCSFTVSIRTSCSSIRYTRDHISLAFGDAYGNQVYAPRLDDPSTGTFERCSTDTFVIYGPCTYQICYLYLYRSGYDGWIPYDVTVYAYNSRTVTFYFNELIPAGIWYGFDDCYYYGVASSSAMK